MTRSALFFIAALLSLLPIASPQAHATSGVLIVTGLTGSSQNDEEFQHLSDELKRLAVDRGFPANSVETLAGKVTRANVLDHLQGAM